MDIHQRFFFFSHTQLEEKKKIASKMNQEYTPGMVMVNGQMQPFTTMTNKQSINYPDAKLVASGRIDKIHHTPERYE